MQELQEARPEPQVAVPSPQEKEWRPSKEQALREYQINIRFLSRGCIVRVGCK